MHCFYINLESATQRRSAIEANFAESRKQGWSLERIAAIDTAYVARAEIPGSIRPAEKACFLSHRNAVFHSLGNDDHAFILEDDSVFSPKTCAAVDALMATPPSPNWDILFTDIGLSDIATMVELILLRNQIDPTRAVKTLNLKSIGFFGATAYVINKASKAKVFALLNAAPNFDVAYDLYLRNLVAQSRVQAHAVFPFVTTSSDLGDTSTVQPGSDKTTDLIMSLFRKVIWIDGGVAAHRDVLSQIDQSLGEDARALGTLWAAMVDKNFKRK